MEKEPFVLNNVLSDWPASKWSPDKLSEILGSKELKFRVGTKKNTNGRVLFENQCHYRHATVCQFLNWLRGTETQPFKDLHPETHFVYLDYQYMFDLFEDETDLKAIDWSSFGLNRDGFESTFWMGTEGAFTPCHYDTYGFNLVAQLYGRKRWTLFPPEDSHALNPTRLPYEESSVFAGVDLLHPSSIRRLTSCHPKTIVLEPGDLLYVPRHWWHFVQCLDDGCISVNTWVDLECDEHAKLSEAITRTFIALVKDKCSDELLDNEVDLEDSLNCLNKLLISTTNNDDTKTEEQNEECCGKNFNEFVVVNLENRNDANDDNGESSVSKKRKIMSTDEISGETFLNNFVNVNAKRAHYIPTLTPNEFCSIMGDTIEQKICNNDENEIVKNDNSKIDQKTLINALLNPRTIETLKQVLLDSL